MSKTMFVFDERLELALTQHCLAWLNLLRKVALEIGMGFSSEVSGQALSIVPT